MMHFFVYAVDCKERVKLSLSAGEINILKYEVLTLGRRSSNACLSLSRMIRLFRKVNFDLIPCVSV